MRLDELEESSNVEVQQGGGRRVGGRGIGLGTIGLMLVAMYFGVDPSMVMNVAQQLQPAETVESSQADVSNTNDPRISFVKKTLWSTEQVWRALLKTEGVAYQPPVLQIFSGQTRTQCGAGQAAMGPFYCPADQKVYIDLSFYQEMQDRFHAPGDFAQAYVVAHEVGHHLQNLLGTSDQVHQAQQNASSEAEANQYSVRLELQADCYSGVWAHHADANFNILEAGDVEEALNAAAAIGDDALQKQAQGYAVPDSFTHGSSKQRVFWFNKGLKEGTMDACDTFSVAKV